MTYRQTRSIILLLRLGIRWSMGLAHRLPWVMQQWPMHLQCMLQLQRLLRRLQSITLMPQQLLLRHLCLFSRQLLMLHLVPIAITQGLLADTPCTLAWARASREHLLLRSLRLLRSQCTIRTSP